MWEIIKYLYDFIYVSVGFKGTTYSIKSTNICYCTFPGILKVRGLKEKSKQLVRRNTMVFYIIHGKLSVSIHNTTQILQTGDTFFVPQGKETKSFRPSIKKGLSQKPARIGMITAL